jgi:hypothetical protein
LASHRRVDGKSLAWRAAGYQVKFFSLKAENPSDMVWVKRSDIRGKNFCGRVVLLIRRCIFRDDFV